MLQQPACDARRQCSSSLRLSAPLRALQHLQPASHRRRRAALRPAAQLDDGPQGDAAPEQPSASAAASSDLDRLAQLADLNQLQTALNTAIAADNFETAAKIRDVLRMLTGGEGGGGGGAAALADWKALGILGWLADRAENLGYNFPTGGAVVCGCWAVGARCPAGALMGCFGTLASCAAHAGSPDPFAHCSSHCHGARP